MPTTTPLLERVRRDPYALPAGTFEWASRLEARLLALHAAVDSARARSSRLRVLDEVWSEVDELVSCGGRSPIARALDRPTPQLEPESAALRAVERRVAHVVWRGRMAVRLQRSMDDTWERVRRLREIYGVRLPSSAARHIAQASLTDSDLERVRGFGEVRSIRSRIEAVESILARLYELLPTTERVPVRMAPPRDGVVPEPLLIDELRAALTLRLKHRAAMTAGATHGADGRRLVARHLNEMRTVLSETDVAPAGTSTPSPGHAVARLLAARSLEPFTPIARQHEDVPVWFAALRAGADALYKVRGDDTPWPDTVEVPPAPLAPAGITAADYFVVPIDESYAYVASRAAFAGQSGARPDAARTPLPAVRIYGDIVLGAQTECQLYPTSSDRTEDASLAALDVAPLFGGFDHDVAGWYRTIRGRRAVLTVLAEDGGHFFARIERRGKVERLRDAPWEECGRDERAVRVLRASAPTNEGDSIDVAPPSTSHPRRHAFLGFATEDVGTPLARHPMAWLRTSQYLGIDAAAALAPERELFARLACQDRAIAPHFLTLARCASTRRSGLLYAPPFAVAAAEGFIPLAHWLIGNRDNPRPDDRARVLACLHAVARVVRTAHDVGFALFTCHLHAFAFTPSLEGAKPEPSPRAALVYAPLATPLGECARTWPDEAHLETATYERLRFRGALPQLVSGIAATKAVDAAAFALLVLELTATPAVGAGPGWLSWEDMLDATDRHAGRRYRGAGARFARDLRDRLADPARWDELLPLLDAAANDDGSSGNGVDSPLEAVLP